MADRPERDNRRGGRKGAEKYAASALTKRITSITRMLPSFAVLFLKEARSSPEELRELVHIISVA